MKKTKGEMVFAKGKDGHYRYMNKKELKNKNRPLTILTFLFYIVVIITIVCCGFFLYNDYLKDIIEKIFN